MARALPQSLYDRARLLHRVHSLRAVSEILRVHHSAVYRMKERNWKATRQGPRQRPIPTDFVIQAKTMTHRELVAHYHARPQVVTRWFRERPIRPPFKPGPKRFQPWTERGWR